MVRSSKLRSSEEIAAEELRNPGIRREYERTAFANAVAIRVLRYRSEHGLSQTALARQLGRQQPAIARLETGEHEPSLATLARLAQGLGIDFSIEITPDARAQRHRLSTRTPAVLLGGGASIGSLLLTMSSYFSRPAGRGKWVMSYIP